MANEKLLKYSVVVPVYREEFSISPFVSRTTAVLNEIAKDYEIIFALDPSPDRSEAILREIASRNPNIKIILMSRRFGQPAATIAGLSISKGDRVVVIDVDLQDPPELIYEMNNKMNEGFDVVYATRKRRAGETIFKRLFAKIGYAVINRLSDVEIPRNTGDYRIMSRRVVEEICQLNEKHAFLRGLVSYVGFNQTYVEYDRDIRFAGESKYNKYWGSIRIGVNGLVGFSAKPLAYVSLIGSGISIISFLLSFWYLGQKFIGVPITPGLSSTLIFVTFFSGIQLLSLGVIGEYVTRIYDQVRNRPMFIIKEIVEEKTPKL